MVEVMDVTVDKISLSCHSKFLEHPVKYVDGLPKKVHSNWSENLGTPDVDNGMILHSYY
jgi:hypothetical protein